MRVFKKVTNINDFKCARIEEIICKDEGIEAVRLTGYANQDKFCEIEIRVDNNNFNNLAIYIAESELFPQ